MPSRLKGLPKFVHRDTKIIILGSFPGPMSLAKKEYYGNPLNHFWRILSGVLDEKMPLSYKARLRMLKKHGIGLWDVVESCERVGAADSKICKSKINDIGALLKEFPQIQAIFIDGQMPYKLFKRSQTDIKIPYFKLLSSSSANASHSLEEKIRQWRVMRKFGIMGAARRGG